MKATTKTKSNPDDSFEKFWEAYPLRKGKLDAERAWKRLSAKDRRAAIAGIPAYVADCQKRGISFKYPQGFLNGHRWEDEILTEIQPPCNEQMVSGEALGAAGDTEVAGGINGIEVALPEGRRWPSEEEMTLLAQFKEALAKKRSVKPELHDEYIKKVIEPMTIAYVSTFKPIRTFICLAENKKPARLTRWAIDYYDSYNEFVTILSNYFDVTKISFDF